MSLKKVTPATFVSIKIRKSPLVSRIIIYIANSTHCETVALIERLCKGHIEGDETMNTPLSLNENLLKSIRKLGKDNFASKIILFGSRARGDYKENSDIDLAVWMENDFNREARFMNEVEELETLLKIDVVFISGKTEDALVKVIEKEGILIYERFE